LIRGAPDATLQRVLRTRRPWARHWQAGVAVCVALVLAACGSDADTPTKDRERPRRPTTTTAAAETTTTSAGPITYTVKRGDNLAAIARFFHVPIDALVLLNRLESSDRIAEGQVLQIPPSPPVSLVVTPASAAANTVFDIALSGAIPGESVTFAITSPDGGVFEGQPHAVPEEGTATGAYRSAGEPPGTFTVVATGDRGTNATATFVVEG
jgi:LysM repeat protein